LTHTVHRALHIFACRRVIVIRWSDKSRDAGTTYTTTQLQRVYISVLVIYIHLRLYGRCTAI